MNCSAKKPLVVCRAILSAVPMIVAIAVLVPASGVACGMQTEAVPPSVSRPAGVSPVRLTNHTWRLVALNGHAVDPAVSKPPQMNLTEDGAKIVGYTGCNRFIGTYLLHDQELRVSDSLAVTRMACRTGMDLEGDFVKALQSVDSWTIVDGFLELSSQKVVVARFKAV